MNYRILRKALIIDTPDFDHCPIFNDCILAPVKITECNGVCSVPFSNARLSYNLERGLPLSSCYRGGVKFLLKVLGKKRHKPTIEENEALERLEKFIIKEMHKKCLKGLKKVTKEAEVQAVLAVHLFAPLVAGSECIIDSQHFPNNLKNCPICDEKLKFGNTSFGHVKVWHGYTDILVHKSAVKVNKAETVDTSDERRYMYNEDYDSEDAESGEDEPTVKKARSDDFTKQGETSYGSVKKPVSQALAQTIVNAFCEVRATPDLSNVFIPSIFATEKTVTISMYNCDQDRLLTSQPLRLFDREEVDISTVLYIWLSLNFNVFENKICAEEAYFPKSNFKDLVTEHSKYDIYSEGVSRPLELATKEEPPLFRLSVGVYDSEMESVFLELKEIYSNYHDPQN